MLPYMGLDEVLGRSMKALLCLWMIMARLIDQGSRLSAVRLAEKHAVVEFLGLSDFNEDDLYNALDWLGDHQDKIEKNYSSESALTGNNRYFYMM